MPSCHPGSRRGSLPARLTWEEGTRSKFFPSILRMCFRAWEVIWCLRRKENWQPSRMQWKWLFTWLYLQPVDTAPLGREPPPPASAHGTPCVSGTVLGMGLRGQPGKWLLGKGRIPIGGVPVRRASSSLSPQPQKVPGPLAVQSLALASSLHARDNRRLAPGPCPCPRAGDPNDLSTRSATSQQASSPHISSGEPRCCLPLDQVKMAASRLALCPAPPHLGFAPGREQIERAGPKRCQQRAGEGLPVAMASELARCLISSPSFGPSYHPEHPN